MKRNSLKNASLVALTALFFSAVLASCNNAGTGSAGADTNKMTSGDTSTMKTAPMAPMDDTNVHHGDQKSPEKDTTKGDQKLPPRN